MKKVFLIIILIFLFGFPSAVSAQNTPPKEETIEAVITKITEEKIIEPDGKEQLHQTLQLTVTSGSIKGRKITIENGNLDQINVQRYQVDDKVLAIYTKNFEGKDIYFIQDYIRRDWLYLLFFIFVGVVIAIGAKRGGWGTCRHGILFLYDFCFHIASNICRT